MGYSNSAEVYAYEQLLRERDHFINIQRAQIQRLQAELYLIKQNIQEVECEGKHMHVVHFTVCFIAY